MDAQFFLQVQLLSLFDDLAIGWLLGKPLAVHEIGLANGERPDAFQRAQSMPPPDRNNIESR